MRFCAIILFLLLGLPFVAKTQYEDAGPIHYGQLKKHKPKSLAGSFDSTFIYVSDTLTLPVFDDFSTNKFQVYDADYSDPGVTSVKEYRLLDLTSNPLPNDVLYTQQQTFRRVFDISNGTFSDTYLTPTSIQVGNLSSYPPSYQTIDAYPPYYIYDTIDFPNDPDTIWILDAELYQDSASQFFVPVNDPELYWLDHHAYHNYSMALDPWSIGVVTFDGTDQEGYPYAIGTSTSGPADYLTSKPIDLSSYSPSDSVYLSFLFQAQGLCDPPEASGSGSDSLYLQFYNKLTDEWSTVWSGGGSSVEDFDYGHIRLDAPGYFNDYFQFRFYNYGSLAGALDQYHLDYVHLRDLSGYQDTLFKDYSLVYPVYSLLKDYTSVPWDHYKNNFSGKMSDQVQLVVRNGSNLSENNSTDGSIEVSYGGTTEGTFVLSGPQLSNGSLNYAPRTTYYSYHDFSAGYHFDETKPGIEQVFDLNTKVSAQFPNFTGNDSIFGQQVFKNYYSYDDGTAELSYGPTGAQSLLAIKYEPYEADSLVGALIHFAPTPIDVSNNLFLLTVWADNGGVPGAILYQDNSFFPRQPAYAPERNTFVQYIFKDTVKVPVSGTFYIGWRQIDPERLGVGLDMNIPNADRTFLSVDQGASWQQSAFAGSVMIRPIFSTAMDFTLGIEEKVDVASQTILYPNPAQSMIHLDHSDDKMHNVELLDLTGKVLFSTEQNDIDISRLSNGIYLIRVVDTDQILKFIKH